MYFYALQYFPSHFSSSFISKPMAFFFSTWLPVTPLEVSRLGLKTVCLSERPRGRKGGAECRLFFILKQPHAPRRGTFSANRSENFAITDVCNWQIILMVILNENHRSSTTRVRIVPHCYDVWRCHIDISRLSNLLRDINNIIKLGFQLFEITQRCKNDKETPT